MAKYTLERYTGVEPRTETVHGVTWRRYTVLKNGEVCRRISHVWAADKDEALTCLRGLVENGHTR